MTLVLGQDLAIPQFLKNLQAIGIGFGQFQCRHNAK